MDVGRIGGDDASTPSTRSSRRRSRSSTRWLPFARRIGADAKEVERGLKTERRIGPRAYLSAGGAFAGGTLARDVTFLRELRSRLHRTDPAHGCACSQAIRRIARGRDDGWSRDLGDLAGVDKSRCGASPTSQAPIRCADPAPSSCAAGWRAVARWCTSTIRRCLRCQKTWRVDAPSGSGCCRCRRPRARCRNRVADLSRGGRESACSRMRRDCGAGRRTGFWAGCWGTIRGIRYRSRRTAKGMTHEHSRAVTPSSPAPIRDWVLRLPSASRRPAQAC